MTSTPSRRIRFPSQRLRTVCGRRRECGRLCKSCPASSPTKPCSSSTIKWMASIVRCRKWRPNFSRRLMVTDKPVREHLLKLLEGGHAHVTFEAAVKGLPSALRGKRPKGAEHSAWETL